MVAFGMGMAPAEPISKVTWVAKMAEDLGFEYFMNADQIFNGERDAFVSLSACAMSTNRIKLGTCVSNPFSRIPGMLALAIAIVPDGPSVIVVSGGVRSTDQVRVAGVGSRFPVASRTRTLNVCTPIASPP